MQGSDMIKEFCFLFNNSVWIKHFGFLVFFFFLITVDTTYVENG